VDETAGGTAAGLPAEARRYLEAHRVGHLATVDAAGHPSVVPLCYATDGAAIYSALDDKPKRVPPEELRRVRNIRAHPEVALVVDDYSEEWAHLSYLLIRGPAEVLAPGGEEHARAVALLRARYPQYWQMPIQERPILRIQPLRAHLWRAGGEALGDRR
jgi:PPOX class probable F420-dependent enzyme